MSPVPQTTFFIHLFLLAHLLLLSVSGAALPLNLTFVNGVFSEPEMASLNIGSLSSSLNAAVTAAFSRATGVARVPSAYTLLNSSSGALSYLYVTGSLSIDEPLVIQGALIVVLVDAKLQATDSFVDTALVLASNSKFSALISPGGPSRNSLSCLSPSGIVNDGVRGVWALQSPNFLIDGVNISDCGGKNTSTCTAAVQFSGAPYVTGGTIIRSHIQNSCRAVWVLVAQRVVVISNSMYNNSKHTVDYDAFTSAGVVYNNTIQASRQEGVFIEQGAQNIVVVGNTLVANNQGVAIFNYNFANATKGHVILANTIINNKNGMSIGSSTSAGTDGVYFINNYLSQNTENFHVSGPNSNTWLIENYDSNIGSLASISPAISKGAQFALFDPLDRISVSSDTSAGAAGVTVTATPTQSTSATRSPTPSVTTTAINASSTLTLSACTSALTTALAALSAAASTSAPAATLSLMGVINLVMKDPIAGGILASIVVFSATVGFTLASMLYKKKNGEEPTVVAAAPEAVVPRGSKSQPPPGAPSPPPIDQFDDDENDENENVDAPITRRRSNLASSSPRKFMTTAS